MENQPSFNKTHEQGEQPEALTAASLLAQHGGDINEAAIAVQRHHGVDVGPEWWEENVTKVVGNDASPEQMAAAFDAAFPDFLKNQQ